MNRLAELMAVGELTATYSAEGLALLESSEPEGLPERALFILLTDTKTFVSKVSRFVTGDPYNHISLMLSDDFDEGIYTFSLSNGLNGLRGGFMVEDRKNLQGSHYSMYRMVVTRDVYAKVQERVQSYVKSPDKTSYNHLGLFNAIFKKNIFANEDGQSSICSEFVAEVLNFSGIELFKERSRSSIRPYEFIKSKLLKFYKRGKIK